MAMGRRGNRRGDLMMTWAEVPRSPGHVFYDRVQSVLVEADFDGFVETTCKPDYAARDGAPSIPPGRTFRRHMVGYFKGIGSERGLEWRCSDSLSLRDFLLLEGRQRVPDHSWLSKTRGRLPHAVHEAVFNWVLSMIADAGLVKGERFGVEASTMEANAALRALVRHDTGEGDRETSSRAGMATRLPAGQSPTTLRVSNQGSPERPSSRAPNGSSDPSPTISIAVACAAPGCAAARTCTSATCSTSPATI